MTIELLVLKRTCLYCLTLLIVYVVMQ